MGRLPVTGRNGFKVFVFCLLLTWVCGCALQKSAATDRTQAMKGIRRIAVLPVKGMAEDEKLIRLMREKVRENLYFRGYPKVPLEVVDEKLSKAGGEESGGIANPIPGDVRQSLGVDAVLYIDLKEFEKSAGYIYSSVSVSAVFELRNAGTGETLWRNQYQDVIRNFSAGASGREMAIRQVLEPAIQEVVDKGLQTFPEGPDAVL